MRIFCSQNHINIQACDVIIVRNLRWMFFKIHGWPTRDGGKLQSAKIRNRLYPIQSFVRTLSGPEVLQIFICILSVRILKIFFSIRTDSVQILIWTRQISVKNLYRQKKIFFYPYRQITDKNLDFVWSRHFTEKYLYGFGRESGPDLNLYAICPPLIMTVFKKIMTKCL